MDNSQPHNYILTARSDSGMQNSRIAREQSSNRARRGMLAMGLDFESYPLADTRIHHPTACNYHAVTDILFRSEATETELQEALCNQGIKSVSLRRIDQAQS